MKCKHMSLEERRKLLDSAKGRFFEAEWIKKSGEVRKATCKKWMSKYLHGKPGENKNTVAHKPEYYTICEQAVEGYRNISLDKLVKVKINGVLYEFDGE
jgi:hypothetical protein